MQHKKRKKKMRKKRKKKRKQQQRLLHSLFLFNQYFTVVKSLIMSKPNNRHIMFTDDETVAATVPAYSASQQTSPPKASSSSSVNQGNQVKRDHSSLSNGTINGVIHTKLAIKRPKVANFRESDNEEEEDNRSAFSGPSFTRDGNVRTVAAGQNKKKDARMKLRQEAARLETGRKQLPIWEGKYRFLVVSRHCTKADYMFALR